MISIEKNHSDPLNSNVIFNSTMFGYNFNSLRFTYLNLNTEQIRENLQRVTWSIKINRGSIEIFWIREGLEKRIENKYTRNSGCFVNL